MKDIKTSAASLLLAIARVQQYPEYLHLMSNAYLLPEGEGGKGPLMSAETNCKGYSAILPSFSPYGLLDDFVIAQTLQKGK
jgi:hypothetical protein